jgi:hypothetical protein
MELTISSLPTQRDVACEIQTLRCIAGIRNERMLSSSLAHSGLRTADAADHGSAGEGTGEVTGGSSGGGTDSSSGGTDSSSVGTNSSGVGAGEVTCGVGTGEMAASGFAGAAGVGERCH